MEARVRIGRVEITSLVDGRGDIGPMTESYPDVSRDELLAARDRYPDIYTADDAWTLTIRAWLLRHPGGTLLLDTGVGVADWFPEPGRIHRALAEAGCAAADIDTVVLSHVHDDHTGGTMSDDGTTPAFPNARYLVQAADVAAQRAWATENDEDRGVWERLVRPLLDAGVADQVDGDHDLTDLLRLQHAPGHTPGHQILHVEDAGAHLILSADTWNHPGQIPHPEWPAASDADAAGATATRRALLPTFTAEPSPLLAPAHFAEPFGTIGTDLDGHVVWRPHTS